MDVLHIMLDNISTKQGIWRAIWFTLTLFPAPDPMKPEQQRGWGSMYNKESKKNRSYSLSYWRSENSKGGLNCKEQYIWIDFDSNLLAPLNNWNETVQIAANE